MTREVAKVMSSSSTRSSSHACTDAPALSSTRCALHSHRVMRELRPANSLSGSTEIWVPVIPLPRRAPVTT